LLVLVPWPRKIRPWLSWLAAGWTSLYIWGDLLYFRFFNDLASVAALRAAGQTSELSDSVRYLTEWRDAWLAVDLAVGLILVLRLRSWIRGQAAAPRLARRVLVGLLVVALFPGFRAVNEWRAAAAAGKRTTLPPRVAVERYGLYGFQLRDLSAQLRKSLAKSPLTEDEFAEIVAWFETRAPRRAGTGRWFGVGATRRWRSAPCAIRPPKGAAPTRTLSTSPPSFR
jgi:hypothetical protein